MSIAIASDAALGISHEERLQRALAGDESAFAWIVETFSSDSAMERSSRSREPSSSLRSRT